MEGATFPSVPLHQNQFSFGPGEPIQKAEMAEINSINSFLVLLMENKRQEQILTWTAGVPQELLRPAYGCEIALPDLQVTIPLRQKHFVCKEMR